MVVALQMKLYNCQLLPALARETHKTDILGFLLNTDSDLMANMYIVLNCRRKLLEHAYGYYRMELKLAFSSL
jgi:hypothetical protein